MDPAIRYHAKVNKRGPDECWPWTAGCFESGYGAFRLGPKQLKAHRFGYQLLVGPIPDGLYVLHRCDNPPCQNPSHWFLGTHKDNAEDRQRKSRQTKARGNLLHGDTCPWATLTEDDVLAIRRLYSVGVTQPELAERFQISQTGVSKIVRGKIWSHASGPVATSNRTVKLTADDVRRIRALYAQGMSQQTIADLFSVRQTTVSEITLRKTWRDVS